VEQAPKLEGNSMTMVIGPVRRARTATVDDDEQSEE
jgi:hypothetical protein